MESNINQDEFIVVPHKNLNVVDVKKGGKRYLAAVGFEPTPPERLVPKTSALDRSATLPRPVIRLSPTVVTGREQHFGDKRERNFSPIT